MPAFYIMRDSKRAMRSIETVRGDCFGARVRAAERRSEAGESRRLRQRRHGLCIVRDDFLQGFGCRRNAENIFFMWFTQTKPVSLL